MFAINRFFYFSICIFFVTAIAASLHDTNSDGLYIVSLDKPAQAHFVGVRTLFYQVGKLAGKGGLVFIIGILIAYFGKPNAWQIGFILVACLIFIMALYHKKTLPHVEKNFNYQPLSLTNTLSSFKNVFKDFAQMPHLSGIIIFVIIYNLAEAQLFKIVPLFLLDKFNHGGLALSVKKVAVIYGTLGTVAMLLGVSLSGFLLAKIQLKKFLTPVTIFARLTNVGYFLLSYFSWHHLWQLGFFIALAEFGLASVMAPICFIY